MSLHEQLWYSKFLQLTRDERVLYIYTLYIYYILVICRLENGWTNDKHPLVLLFVGATGLGELNMFIF